MSSERITLQENHGKKHFVLLDMVRAFAIITVVIYHLLQQMFGVGFLIWPDGLSANWQRLEIFKGGGIWAWLQNILMAPFAYGFGAVSVFLMLSGFGLTWSLLQKNSAAVKWGEFYLKKFRRLLVPFYISVLITFLLLAFRNWAFPNLSWWPSFGWLDYLKLVIPPFLVFDVHLLQQLEGAYWYITIILQFYLIYPLLYLLLKKMGTGKFLIVMLVLTLVYRVMATYGYGLWGIAFLDTAPMGVVSPAQNSYYGFCFFLPRLFEFAMGMALASWQNKNGRALDWLTLEWLAGKFALLAGLLIAAGGYTLDYFRFGWIFSDSIIGLGLFIVFLNLAKIISNWKILERIFKRIGDVSYEIYLLHHQLLQFILFPLVMAWGLQNEVGFWIILPVFLIGSWLIGEIGKWLP